MSKAQLALDAINSLGSKTATAIARITHEFGAHNTAAAAAALAAEGGGSQPQTVTLEDENLDDYLQSEVIDTSGLSIGELTLDVDYDDNVRLSSGSNRAGVLTRRTDGLWQDTPMMLFSRGASFDGYSPSNSGVVWQASLYDVLVAHPKSYGRRRIVHGLLDESILVVQQEWGADPEIITDFADTDANLRIVYTNGTKWGERISIAFLDPGANDQPLWLGGSGFDYEFNLATDGSGNITTTAQEIADYTQDDPWRVLAPMLFQVSGHAGLGDGSGVVEAMEKTNLVYPEGGSDPVEDPSTGYHVTATLYVK